MYYGPCALGNWGSLGYSGWGLVSSFGVWGWIGLILNLFVWIGLFGILALLVARAARGARFKTSPIRDATGEQTAMEILQARYARSEITREQYDRMKQDIG